jgi:hypothetical protein
VIELDKFARTVRLPVRMTGGQLMLADGKTLPKIEDDTIADLIIPAYALLADEDRALWTKEESRDMFREETSLWARVRGKHDMLLKASGCCERRMWANVPASVVEIRLLKPLRLILRAGKTSMLGGCRCAVPALKLEVDSINEAYTRISEKYETHRKSFGGNVFRYVYYEGRKFLEPLDTRRMEVECEALPGGAGEK